MPCILPNLEYSDLSKKLHNKALQDKIPISGALELTYDCNFNCVHCYVKDCNEKKEKDLSFNQIKDILDQIADAGCLWLLLTGGEPLMRKDFLDIYMYAKRKGFLITVFTNGSMITSEIVKCFSEFPPFNIEITIYGATEETYERITQRSNSYAKCIAGIDLLSKNEISFQLKSILLSYNKHELDKLSSLSVHYGLPFVYDPIISPKLNGDKTPRKFSLSPEEIVQFDLKSKENINEWNDFYKNSLNPKCFENLYRCYAGKTTFMINPYGKLQFCVLARDTNYDLKIGEFKDGWYNVINPASSKKAKSDYKCNRCELLKVCGQCPGWSYLEHGNHEEPVDYLCKIAHKRAQTFLNKGELK